MCRVFITGDKHGSFDFYDYEKVRTFCYNLNTTKEDVLIVLGDHGIHYDEGTHDEDCKKILSSYPITFVMIRGNHDMRPCADWPHRLVSNDTLEGMFIADPLADNILYTEEYGWYRFGRIRTFVIGGAYSADKFYRLKMQEMGRKNYRWFADEQLNDVERNAAEFSLLHNNENGVPFVIMSHTCPERFTPVEMFLPQVDQSTVDKTMEVWLDDLLDKIQNAGSPLLRWFCGHWHTDKMDGLVRFVYHDIIELEDA